MKVFRDIPVQNWALAGEPFRLAAVAVEGVEWEAGLPADVRGRLSRFPDPRVRARAGASEWLKNVWLPQELGLDGVEFETGANGKPILRGAAAEWGFNLSHAGSHAVAVVSRGAEVGVDLESIRRQADVDRLAARVFSVPEQARVREGGRDVFFQLWSQKEALLKALGCGWADGKIQRRTDLEPVAYHIEPATGAQVWSRRVLDGEYELAVARISAAHQASPGG